MTRRTTRLACCLLIGSAALTACHEDPTGPGPATRDAVAPEAAAATAPAAAVPHFRFLEPLLPPANPTGTFDPAVAPAVSICVLKAGGACGREIARYTPQGGPGGERVTLDRNAERYQANWRTRSFGLSDARNYRITVTVGRTTLGWVDLDVSQGATVFRNLATNTLVPLSSGGVLPIRFRIEAGLVARIRVIPDSLEAEIRDQVPFTARLFDLHGRQLAANSALVEWSTSNAQVMDIDLSSGFAVAMSEGTAAVTARVGTLVSDRSDVIVVRPRFLAFVSTRDGNGEIYSMTGLGKAQTNLTKHPAEDTWPNWAPDGSRIAFTSERDGARRLYVMMADGSGQIRVSTTGTHGKASWSPDGTRLAFSDGRRVYAVNPDGTGQTTLLPGVDEYDDTPVWSPDGSKIAFTVSPSTAEARPGGMYLMNPDGTGQTRISSSFGLTPPTWSPDGTRIAVAVGGRLVIIRTDGSGTTTYPLATGGEVSWAEYSPVGAQIAFSNYPDLPYQVRLELVNDDGTGQTALTDSLVASGLHTWAPDALQLAFVRGDQIYTINPSGSQLKARTTLGRNDWPDYRP